MQTSSLTPEPHLPASDLSYGNLAGVNSQSVAIVLNRHARRATPQVLHALGHIVSPHDIFVSRNLTDAEQIARKIVERKYSTVLVGGGDGTFVRCISDLAKVVGGMDKLPRLGILRLGTGNGMADALGASPCTPEGFRKDVKRAQTAAAKPLSLLSVEGRLAPFCGFGLDTRIQADYAAVRAQLTRFGINALPPEGRYAVSIAIRTLPRFIFQKMQSVRVTNIGPTAWKLDHEGKAIKTFGPGEVVYDGPFSLSSCGTIPYFGLGMRIFPFVNGSQRVFQFRVSNVGSLAILSHIPKLFAGTWRSPQIHDFHATALFFEFENGGPFQIGGDVIGERTQVEVRLAPHTVPVIRA